MTEPGELISNAGSAFVSGDFSYITENCEYPMIFSIDGMNFSIESSQRLTSVLEGFHEDISTQGIVDGKTQLVSVMVNESSAYIAASTKFADKTKAIVKESLTEYVMHQYQDAWKAIAVVVSKKANVSENMALKA